MTSTEKIKIIDNICKTKYGLNASSREETYMTYWYMNISDSPIVSYDSYYDKLKLATYIIFNDKGIPLFCVMSDEKLADFEKSLDTLMKSYKKKLIQIKINELNKDFED